MNTSRLQLIIEDMIEDASKKKDYTILGLIRELIDEIVTTHNAPSNWKDIGEELSYKYKDSWIYDELELADYESDI